ncbi:hypothetical protein EDEG_01796 [Edhazardia aedis USNM 41457]|uniref:Uncharacterized protein n=1 Tax=Edhazardia aedis (strain USNM 41457) TaxID=1003232 RepID=J8ZW52_EDHAE|nr:hypothetical protein EDEG_01796 [Edhazardia aedis USNM 41457]|eukprot:EJW03918.1 hypothetical protein EDEG_01796 [Edhazardia aedis USNM 41457]
MQLSNHFSGIPNELADFSINGNMLDEMPSFFKIQDDEYKRYKREHRDQKKYIRRHMERKNFILTEFQMSLIFLCVFLFTAFVVAFVFDDSRNFVIKNIPIIGRLFTVFYND